LPCPEAGWTVLEEYMTRKRDIKQIDAVVRKLKLSKEQRQLLHQVIHGENLTFRELLEVAREIQEDYPSR
jgi:hypothetical protein